MMLEQVCGLAEKSGMDRREMLVTDLTAKLCYFIMLAASFIHMFHIPIYCILPFTVNALHTIHLFYCTSFYFIQ